MSSVFRRIMLGSNLESYNKIYYTATSKVIPQNSLGYRVVSNTWDEATQEGTITCDKNITSIGNYAFSRCTSLTSITIPNSVTSIGNYAFRDCSKVTFYDFSSHTSIPTLQNSNAFEGITTGCKIIVPDALYNQWIAATNWSGYASHIIKKSDWDASQS